MSFRYFRDPASLRGGAAMLIACGALGACSSPAGNTASVVESNVTVSETTVPNEAAAAPAPGDDPKGTIGGDGSEIILSPLTAADIEGAKLEGELACSFGTSAGGPPMLLAKGDVGSQQPSMGVVKIGDYVETISAPGGFDAMVAGATFNGRGQTIRIAGTGGEAAGGGESPPMLAKLTYDRADGARRVIEGLWTCGP